MMEFVLQPKSPVRSFAGFAIVVGLHAAIVLGLMFGLARNHLTFNSPVLIDWVSIVDPAPPASRLPKLRPVAQHAAQVFIPQDAALDIPVAVVDVVAVRAIVPVPEADAYQSVPVPTDSVSSMESVSLGTVCPNASDVRSTMRYPPQARRDGVQGDVLARFIVGANGDIHDINIVSTSNRAFNASVIRAVREFKCIAHGRTVTVEVPFSFRLE